MRKKDRYGLEGPGQFITKVFSYFVFILFVLGCSHYLAYKAGEVSISNPKHILVFESQEVNIWASPDGDFEFSKGDFFHSVIFYSEACKLASEVSGEKIRLAPFGVYYFSHARSLEQRKKIFVGRPRQVAGVTDGAPVEVQELRREKFWALVLAPKSEK